MKPLKKVLLLLGLSLYTITIQPAKHDVDLNDLYWMSLNIYYEAGNQSAYGKIAVGVVTRNRVNHADLFEKTVEDVVKEHRQFSWYNNKKVIIPPSVNAAWRESVSIAKYVLKLPQDHDIIDRFRGVTHYHATYVKPKWKNYMIKVAQIEDHIFYRMKDKK